MLLHTRSHAIMGLLREAEEDDDKPHRRHELPRHNRPLTPEDMGGKFKRLDPNTIPDFDRHTRADYEVFLQRQRSGELKSQDLSSAADTYHPYPLAPYASDFKTIKVPPLEQLSDFLQNLNRKIAQYITRHLDLIAEFSHYQASRSGGTFDEVHMKHIVILSMRLKEVGTLESILKTLQGNLKVQEKRYASQKFAFLFRKYLRLTIYSNMSREIIIQEMKNSIFSGARSLWSRDNP